jgi:hypothetical protein
VNFRRIAILAVACLSISSVALADVAGAKDDSPLPKQGSIAWNVGISGWLGSFQDLQDFYGAGIVSDQTPYGFDFELGADYTLARSFQLGVQVQTIDRIPETVTFGGVETHQWSAYTVGGALVAKYLIPVQDKWNLILHAEGGFYALVGSGVQASGVDNGTVNLDGSNIGGMFSVEGEFLQGAKKSWALDLGLGYRILKITPLTESGSIGGSPVSGTLKNIDGSDAGLDLSGPRVTATLRFY